MKETFCQQADRVVSGDRDECYGKPADNLLRIAKLWSVLFNRNVTPAEVCQAMILVKIARLAKTPDHADSWIDIAGYVACAEQVTA